MLFQKISNRQNCEIFRNFRSSIVVPNTNTYSQMNYQNRRARKKLFWLDTVMHHYCENSETKSNISRDSHIPGNNKKPFSKNYSFQQSVHNRHPTAALLIILPKKWSTYYKFQSFFYPNISCPQHNFIDKFLNFLINKLNVDIVSKIHSKIIHPFKVFWELKFRIQLSKMVFAKLVAAMYVHACVLHTSVMNVFVRRQDTTNTLLLSITDPSYSYMNTSY